MSYVINSKRLQNDSIITNVTFNINGVIVNTDISHFRPSSLEEIYSNIDNRELSESLAISSVIKTKEIYDLIKENGN